MTDDHPTPPASRPRLPRTVQLLAWASFLNDVASEMVYPQLPRFLLQMLGGNKTYLGLMEGAAEAVSSLVKLWSGARSDQTGDRQRLVVGGYLVATLARPLIAITAVPWQLLSLRVADRIGKGIRTAPRDALIADVTNESNRGRAFGFHRGMDHLGAAVGPLLATAFLWAWPGELRWLFFVSLVPGIAVTILVCLLRQPRTHQKNPSPVRPPLEWRPLGREFRLYLLAVLIFTLGNSSDLFLLVRAGEAGIPDVYLPLLWCAFHVAKSAGNVAVGPIVDRIGPRPLLVAGWLLYAVVYFLFALASTPWHAWALFLAYAGYFALAEPAEKALVARLAGPQHKGLGFGWFNLVVGLGALPASLLFGGLYDLAGPIAAFGTGAGLATLAVAILSFTEARFQFAGRRGRYLGQ
jgi:MFS family permease